MIDRNQQDTFIAHCILSFIYFEICFYSLQSVFMIIRKCFKYTSQFKHGVLEGYRHGVIGCEFKSLAKRFKLKVSIE